MELANEAGYNVVEGDLSPDCARRADEVFATSTAGGVMPITQIDDQAIGSGELGPVTQALQEAYWSRHDDPHFATDIRY